MINRRREIWKHATAIQESPNIGAWTAAKARQPFALLRRKFATPELDVLQQPKAGEERGT